MDYVDYTAIAFLFAFSVQLDVEKALDEQLFFEAFRTERFGRSIRGRRIRGGGARWRWGIVILA